MHQYINKSELYEKEMLPTFLFFIRIMGLASISDISEAKKKEILDVHNSIRRAVKPPASNMLKMEWSEKASQTAQESARRCEAAISPSELRKIDGMLCGENLLTTTFPSSWTRVIQEWKNKASSFRYGLRPINYDSDAYTQLIWYSSYLMGCALAYCPKNNVPYIYACHYCPVGNIVRKLSKPYKSGPSCGRCPDSCEDKLCTNPCRYVDKITGCKTLKVMAKCDGDFLKKNCQATCNCKTEIV
uniref:Cysteine rich secretory protein 3 n=1 Tax=Salvator merianae TaxID=96440 RepID=A0A8D0BN19_SALMN